MKRSLLPSLLCVLASILLMASWLHPGSRVFWDWADQTSLSILNSPLKTQFWLTPVWALANHRVVDFLGLALVFGSMGYWVLKGEDQSRAQRKAQALYISIALGFGAVICKTVGLHLIHLICGGYRASPSLHLALDTFPLSEAVTWVHVKAHSSDSFPSDHSCVLFLWVGLFGFFAPRRYGCAALCFTLISSLPRQAAATHWFSDTFVGSLSLVLFLLPFLLATPLRRFVFKSYIPLKSARALPDNFK